MTLLAFNAWLEEQASSGGEGPFNLSLSLAELQLLQADIASYLTSGRPGADDVSREIDETKVADLGGPSLGQSRDWLIAAGETLSATGRSIGSREVSLAGTNAEQAGLWLDRAISLGAGS